MRWIAVAALASCVVLPALPVETRQAESAPATALASAVQRGDVPGVVAVAANGKAIIYEGAFGMADAGRGRRMTTDTLFRIASMTKAVTSIAVIQLIEEGKMGVDDPLSKFFPELTRVPIFQSFDAATGAYSLRPATKPITVRQLLTHTSGLGYGFTSPIVRDFKPRDGETYPIGPLLFEPGERWLYGSSTDWAGRIVEQVSGMTLEDYFRKRILDPLRMSDTSFLLPADKLARLATVHRRQADGSLVEQANEQPPRPPRFRGDGGLFSTAGDYVRFLRMLLNRGELDGARVLSASSMPLVEANQMGAIGVRALVSAIPPQSSDFTFVADNRDKWSLCCQITVDSVSGKRAPGSLSWGGIDNTYFWFDPRNDVAGVIMMQFLPFADTKGLAVYDQFERAVYSLRAQANRK